MSAIQFLREKAGVFVAGIIGFSLFLFVISDFFGGGRSQRVKQRKYYEIGQIAGEYISYQDYDLRVQNLLEIVKLSGNSNIDEATTESIREQVWQQMVREKIQENQYKKLGIGVSTEELDELVLGDNPHPNVRQLATDPTTGAFNKSFLVNFLKRTEVDENAKKYWLFFENDIVNDRGNTKFNTLVSKGLYATTKEAEFDRTLNNATVDFSFILKNYASISDSTVNISKSDLEAYYTKHKDTFKRNALRDIEYVTFDVVPSEDDIKQAEEWITRTREEFAATENPEQFINMTSDTRRIGFFVPLSGVSENLREFAKKEDRKTVFGPYLEDGSYKIARLIDAADRPDSVHVSHILIGAGQGRTIEQARSKADSLFKLLKAGASIETVAKDNSEDQGSSSLGGDLGWFPEGRMVYI
jgi:peptidyl-prolyl cis-trans isomerase D